MTSHLGLTQLVQGLGSKNLSLFSVCASGGPAGALAHCARQPWL